MLQMQVEVVGIDQVSMQPVVILSDLAQKGFLILVIGEAEATAISFAMRKLDPPRPLTHDVMSSILRDLEVKVEKIVITELVNETYYAAIYLKTRNKRLIFDARPSDSIALALHTDAPIYISEQIASLVLPDQQRYSDDDLVRFRKFLETITPDDFRYQKPE